MKKTIVGLVLALLIAAAAIAVLAVMGSFIGKDEAERIAYQDAALEPPYSRTELGFKNGHFQYEIEFYVDGIEYSYIIRATDGELLQRNTSGSGGLAVKPSATEAALEETAAPEVTEAAPEETAAPEVTEAVPEETAAPETAAPETAAPETDAPVTEPPAEETQDEDTEEVPRPDEAKFEHARTIALSNMGLMDRQADAEFTDEKWSKEGDKIIFELTFTIDDTEYYCKVSEHGEFISSDSHPKED